MKKIDLKKQMKNPGNSRVFHELMNIIRFSGVLFTDLPQKRKLISQIPPSCAKLPGHTAALPLSPSIHFGYCGSVAEDRHQ